MFVDGRQLTRVNFALNSPVRGSYVYFDANSNAEETTAHFAHFGRKMGTDKK
jgi:hypothetical protein